MPKEVAEEIGGIETDWIFSSIFLLFLAPFLSLLTP